MQAFSWDKHEKITRVRICKLQGMARVLNLQIAPLSRAFADLIVLDNASLLNLTLYLLNMRLCCTQADLLQNIPPEFRQNVVLYDTADVRAHYPAHGISEFYSGYLPATWLMHKYQAYEFLYILESVCPLTPCRHNWP